MIDVYNDAKNNVRFRMLCDPKLPESDPYASLLFPQDTLSQQYQQFPKVIDCAKLKQAACKTIVLQELSSVVVGVDCFEVDEHCFAGVRARLDLYHGLPFSCKKDV